jgi:hypothetical protein
MPIDNSKKSSRLLQSRRYTHDGYTDGQEAFTSVLDINAAEVYTDQNLIPSSSLPFSGSGQSGTTYSVNGQSVLKYYYRQPMTKSNLNNEVWFVVDPSGSSAGIGAQLIDANQKTNFISPKYSVPALANATAEDSPPGYLARVFITTTGSGVSPADQVSTNNYAFDYKTGVLQFSSSGVAPSNSQYVSITVNQYVGRTVATNVPSASIAVSSSYATTASYAVNAASVPAGTVSSSAQVVTYVSGSTIVPNRVESNEYKLIAGAVSLIFTGSITSGIFGATEYILPFIPTSSFCATTVEYVASRVGGLRVGIILAGWSGSQTTVTDVSSTDIGDTSDIRFSLVQDGGYVKLRAESLGSGSYPWTVQSLFKLFPFLS